MKININIKSKNILEKLLIAFIIFSLTLCCSSTTYASGDHDKDTSSVTTECGGDCGKLELTKSAIDEGEGKYRISFDVNGDEVVKKGDKADIILMIDVSGSMDESVGKDPSTGKNKTRLDLVKEAVGKFCDLIRSKKTNVDSTDDIRIAVGEFSRGVPEWVRPLSSENKWINNVISKVPDNTWTFNEADGFYYMRENHFWYTSSYAYRKDDSGIEYWKYKEDEYYDKEELIKRDANGVVWHWDRNAHGKYEGDKGDASEVCGFTNVTNAQLAVNTLSSVEGTDTRAGIDLVGKMLEKARSEVKKHVLFFTDGLANISQDVDVSRYGGDYDNLRYMNAVVDDAINEYNVMMKDRENTDFYSVGLIQGLSKNENELALKLLSGIQNAGYKLLNDSSKLDDVFVKIAESIMDKTFTVIAKDVVLTDNIAEEFILPKDIVIEVDAKYRDKIKYNRIDDRKIEFKIDTITNKGFSFSFLINKNDPYYSNKDVKTNNGATITYKDYKGDNQTGNFGDPMVNLYPLKGKVVVEKQLTNDSSAKSEGDSFSVTLQSVKDNEQYNIEISPDETKVMEFYMKDTMTYVKNSLGDNAYGYVTIGHYNVFEFLPAYYKLFDIQISYDNRNFKDYKEFNEADPSSGITIDKDHPEVYIRLVNQKSSEDYWWDKKSKDNDITVVNR